MDFPANKDGFKSNQKYRKWTPFTNENHCYKWRWNKESKQNNRLVNESETPRTDIISESVTDR